MSARPTGPGRTGPPRIPSLFARALVLRCPNCGARGLFRSWFRMAECCGTCGLRLERGEDGYQVGSYMFNIIASELLFAVLFVGIVLATWPDPPWTLLQYGGGGLMILAPLLFFPFSKTLFLAFDLVFRPERQ
ncbi:MAG: DUF983 domain-containing protein [Gemmatimonadales bacterium]